jgi:uncharacterized protein
MENWQFFNLCDSVMDLETDIVLAALDQEPGLITRVDTDEGRTLLHYACEGGNVDLIRDLLDRGANLHQKQIRYGCDALTIASHHNHVPAIELLLSRGANMSARTNAGLTALGIAAFHDKFHACKFLVIKGSDLMSQDNEGRTTLDIYNGYLAQYSKGCTPEQKEQRCAELRELFANGPHPSQVKRRLQEIRNANWGRRSPLMSTVVSCGYRPLPVRLLEQEMLITDLMARGEVAPILLDTSEQRRAYYASLILSNDGLLRNIVGYL